MARNAARWLSSAGGLLGSIGLGFLAVETSIRWMLAVTLALGLFGLFMSARRHRRWWTVGLGAAGAVTAMAGRFALLDVVLYGGMVLLTAALAADLWARKHPWMPLVQIRLRRGGT